MCLTVPSILIELMRYDEAEELIEQCMKFNSGKRMLLHARLELMHASILVFKCSSQRQKQRDPKISELLKNARDTFEHFEQPEGAAETYYVEALFLIN